MSGKLITLITGANQGLGYYAAQHLAATGKHHVLIGSRILDKGKTAVKQLLEKNPSLQSENLEAIQIDITDDKSIEAAAESVKSKFGHLDILINNAAIAGYPPSPGKSLREIYAEVLDTNVVGTAIVTEAFLPLIKASKAPAPGRRIVMVSSTLASMASAVQMGNVATEYVQYNVSKSALNRLSLNYAAVLQEEGIPVVMLCPGHNATNLNNYAGARDPADGATEIVAAATEGGMDMSGKFVKGGQIIPW